MASYSDTGPLPVRSSSGLRVVSTSFVRPNNTTPYAANQLIGTATGVNAGNAILVPNAVFSAGDVFRFDAVRVYKASVAALPVVRVWVWNAAPTLTVGDGGAFGNLTGLATADVDKLVDKLDVTFSMSGSANAVGRSVPDFGNAISVKPVAPATGFYVTLTALGAYTPVANEAFTVLFEGVGQ